MAESLETGKMMFVYEGNVPFGETFPAAYDFSGLPCDEKCIPMAENAAAAAGCLLLRFWNVWTKRRQNIRLQFDIAAQMGKEEKDEIRKRRAFFEKYGLHI